MSAERRRARPRRRLAGAARLALLALFWDGVAGAQAPSAERPRPRGSLRSRIGVEAAEPLLRSESSELRQRAFEKLGAAGTSTALELLADALEPGGAARTANERLTAVRALAAHAGVERARGALVRAMGGAQTRDEPMELMVRQSAALALARAGDRNALFSLAQALRQPGRVSEAARVALRAHPPKAVEPLLLARGVPTPALAGLVGDLRYQRGRELLRALTQSGAPALRAEALGALAKVDRDAAVAVARSLLGNEKHRTLRVAAARVLATARDAEAPAALATLCAEPSLVGDALDIALETPSKAFSPVLARVTPSDPGDAERLLAALGRSGGPTALARLEAALGSVELGWAAAHALARSADTRADDVLERALARPATRCNAARAAALRAREGGSRVSGLDDALESLERSNAPNDRAALSFVRATLDPELGAKLVGSRDGIVVRAAARAALEDEVSFAAAQRLAVETNAELRTALALALTRPDAADRVPTRVLVELFELHGAAAHLAAFALAARDGDAERPRLRELLASGDPLLRAHVALGLARSRESSAIGLLDEAYRFESEPLVRRAIVRALAARTEPGRERTLRLAADLDPDDDARALSRRALASGLRPLAPGETTSAWIRVEGGVSGAASMAVVVVTSGGLALPLYPDPDGSATLAGLPPGPVAVTLASAAPGGDSPDTGSK
jgi:hypothetical protein